MSSLQKLNHQHLTDKKKKTEASEISKATNGKDKHTDILEN